MLNSNHTSLLAMALLGSFVLASGCEEDASGVSINVTQENFCEEIAEVTCHNAFQCCTGLELEANYGIEITTTESECRRDIELRCENIFSEHIWAFENGTASLSTEELELCLIAFLAPDDVCFPYISQDEFGDACEGNMINGLQGSGDDCFFDFECGTDAYCGPDRKCASLPTQGQACPGFQCASGLYCGFDIDTYTYICMPLFSSGEACNNSTECAAGLYCNSTTDTCAPLLDLGDSCNTDENCESGFCLPGVCEGDGSECYTAEECGEPGQCEYSGTTCYLDTDCYYQVCSNTGDFCYDDMECGECSNSGYSCYDDYDCDYYYDPGDTCEFGDCGMESCQGVIPGVCNGNPVCADNWGTLNYCAMNPLMIF